MCILHLKDFTRYLIAPYKGACAYSLTWYNMIAAPLPIRIKSLSASTSADGGHQQQKQNHSRSKLVVSLIMINKGKHLKTQFLWKFRLKNPTKINKNYACTKKLIVRIFRVRSPLYFCNAQCTNKTLLVKIFLNTQLS